MNDWVVPLNLEAMSLSDSSNVFDTERSFFAILDTKSVLTPVVAVASVETVKNDSLLATPFFLFKLNGSTNFGKAFDACIERFEVGFKENQ